MRCGPGPVGGSLISVEGDLRPDYMCDDLVATGVRLPLRFMYISLQFPRSGTQLFINEVLRFFDSSRGFW